MIRLAPLGLVLALALPATPAAAQQDDLDRVLTRFASLWQSGDAGALVQLGSVSGVELQVQGVAMGPLRGRRAVAALRHLFSAQQTVAVQPAELSRVAGADDQAFAELLWVIRPTGVPMRERATIFIGFVREADGWRISQIRILP